ncbi:zinc ABC transporter substrate-binding protein [Notoacmeibacter sp. MSK16QG-6]|nr:zinc ABC transporter substrate-binding protein [Notoacmeibacter sp. MSK16QG-6]
MEGVGKPELLVPPSASPHDFALRPSQAGAMQDADLIIRIGPDLERFLDKPIASLGANAKVLELMEAEGVEHLPTRHAGLFDEEDDDDHGDHDKHAHDDHEKGHDHGEEHAHEEADHHDSTEETGHHDHHHGPEDPHVWLDPDNAKAMVNAIEQSLAEVDPDHAERYRENAEATLRSIDEMSERVDATLKPVKGKSFVAFHDALQYFEHAFELKSLGSLTMSPEIAPGARRLTELNEKMSAEGVSCILVEPQFSPKLSQTLANETGARIAELDPAGSNVEPGPGAYEAAMIANAEALAGCLSGDSSAEN